MGGPDRDRNPRIKFKSRSQTLKTKAHELAKLCGANVYLLIDHPRGTYVYKSTKGKSWPPSDEVLEKHYPNLERLDFSEMETSLDLSKVEREQKNHESNLKRLTRYFASRLGHFQSLEDIFRDLDPAGLVDDEEALENMHHELDHNK